MPRQFFHTPIKAKNVEVAGYPDKIMAIVQSRNDKVPLNAEIAERVELDGYIREKVYYDVENGLSSSAWVCYSSHSHRRSEEKLPAVICCHGDGPGKDPLVGLFCGAKIKEYHKLIAVRLAQKGFITITPDRRGYGDCSAFPKGFPSANNLRELDDFYRRKDHLSLLGHDVRDMLAAVDYISKRASVCGVFGIEAGAKVAAITAADKRIKAASLTSFISEKHKIMGVDAIDICKLIYPKPLQLQMAEADPIFALDDALQASRQVQRIYQDAELCTHVFDGVMEVDYQAVEDFFFTHLEMDK